MSRADGRDNWATPQHVYDEICKYWQVFPTIDVCANADNCKRLNYFDEQQDALKQSWTRAASKFGFRQEFWMNPPYSMPLMRQFIEKAIEESHAGAVTLFLLPANIDQIWFHELILDRYPWRPWRGRISFEPPPGIKPSTPRYGNIHGVIRERSWQDLI